MTDKPDLISPWQPEANTQVIKIIGKLGEELCENGASIFRCLIQGLAESEPVTGKPNLQWLQEEIADVKACLALVEAHQELIPLDWSAIEDRAFRKFAGFQRWLSDMKP